MTEHAGERLFEAIGQIPDKMILEAAQEQADDSIGYDAVCVNTEKEQEKEESKQRPRKKMLTQKLGGYLKYLPVAACLCFALGGAGYVVNSFFHMDQAESIYTSGGLENGEGGGVSQDLAMDEAAAVSEDSEIEESARQYSDGKNMDDAVKENETEDADKTKKQTGMLPVRYDTYDGPVFPLTATGDTQKLKVSRSVKAIIASAYWDDSLQPWMQVTDTYRLKNSSSEEKTLQIVYPFSAALNGSKEKDGDILKIKGAEQTSVTYNIGESIHAYRNAGWKESSTLEDYEHIVQSQANYQERALEKEADWNQNVQVYTFSNIRQKEGADAADGTGVIGVTVKGADADVLTYGFDHSFAKEDGSTNYCFFIPQEEKKIMLIVTGTQEGDPELGYYTNLDCEEKLESVQCDMNSQSMTYANALRLCGNDAVRNLRQLYEDGTYDAVLPEYMNADAAFGALTMIDEEDAFYDTLRQRYESTELTEIYERLFGETRVVYAMMTVTIPAKQSVQIAARINKRQIVKPESSALHSSYQYDFLSGTQSQLPIKKTAFHLTIQDGWRLTDENIGLKQKKERVFKGYLKEQSSYFTITRESVK